MSAPFHHLLLIIDDTEAHVEAVSHAVALARVMGASVAFADLSAEATRRAERAARAAAAAHALGVPFEPWELPVDVLDPMARARSRHVDLVVTASSAWAAAAAAHGLPALLAAAEASTPASRAIEALRGEHRRQADAVRQALQLLASARRLHLPVDARATRTALRALEASCPERHHDLEEQLIFSRLRRRDPAWDVELGELERQHRRDAEHRDDLAQALDALEAAAPDSRLAATQALDECVGAYARFLWEHIGREEGVLWPAARRLLSDADWAAVQASIEQPKLASDQALQRREGAASLPLPG